MPIVAIVLLAVFYDPNVCTYIFIFTYVNFHTKDSNWLLQRVFIMNYLNILKFKLINIFYIVY